MNRLKHYSATFLFLFFSFFLSGIFMIQTTSALADDQKVENKDEKKRELGQWWKRNALKYDPMPEEFLQHFEFKYQYNRDTGNLYRDNHMIDSAYVVRKWRFTNYLMYSMDKRFSGKPGVDLRDDIKHNLHEDFRYAITKALYASIGAIYEVDEIKDIEESITYYGGFGYHIIDTDLIILKVFAALGNRDLEYTYNSDYGFENLNEALLYSEQAFSWYITEDLAFDESLVWTMSIEDTDLYRYSLDLSLSYRIVPHVFLEVTYAIEYENFIDPNLPSFITDNIIKKDTSFSTGVKFSF